MKNIRYIFFDLDGTLLPMNTDDFIKLYFSEITKKFSSTEFDPKIIIEGINFGLKKMYEDTSDNLNEEPFWKGFEEKTEYLKNDVYDMFIDFYSNEFLNLRDYCNDNGYSKLIVDELNDKGYKLILATNPLFPMVAQVSRASLVGLSQNDFEYVTSMENSSKVKPNHQYFEEIISKLKLNNKEVLMVGNDVNDDMYAAKKAGIKTVLITDYLLNNHKIDIDEFEKYSLEQFYKKIVKNIDAI